jgi:hypothetical protein
MRKINEPDFDSSIRHSGRGLQPASPESISQDRGYGFRARAHSKSALADLDIQVPISGKPEIGARPGMT